MNDKEIIEKINIIDKTLKNMQLKADEIYKNLKTFTQKYENDICNLKENLNKMDQIFQNYPLISDKLAAPTAKKAIEEELNLLHSTNKNNIDDINVSSELMEIIHKYSDVLNEVQKLIKKYQEGKAYGY